MIATLVLAAALQAPTNVPSDAEVIYPLMPEVSGLNGVNLQQTIMSVTATLGKSEATYDVLALYKNTSNVDGHAVVVLPFESYRHGFGDRINVVTLWSDAKANAVETLALESDPESGKLGKYTVMYRLPVKRNGTHSLKVRFKLPIGVSGVDREERLVAFRVADLDQTAPLDQFRMAVKFDEKTVFAPIESKPDWGWQVGNEGAYLKMDGKPSDRNAVLAYRYYPAGFADIGWTTGGGGGSPQN
jgi:hypothetical protein